MDFIGLLYNVLSTELPVCKRTSSGDELIIRCVYCGDSVKSTHSAHFYIQTSSPYMCYCQRCGTSRAVSVQMLNDFGIQNRELHVETLKVERERKFISGKQFKGGNSNIAQSMIHMSNDFIIPDYEGLGSELEKLDYVNDRLGTNIDLTTAKELNFILNFARFLVDNEIEPRNMTVSMFNLLNDHCVGFLSQDKNFIIFRSLDADYTGFRYHNYNITGRTENVRKYYTVPQEIDLMNPEVNLVITEGIMDILGVYFNVYDGNPESHFKGNTIFISTNGIGLGLVINTVAKLGFLKPKTYLFSDAEVHLNVHRKIKRNNIFIHDQPVTVYYNKLSKDCGVPRDLIDLKYSII